MAARALAVRTPRGEGTASRASRHTNAERGCTVQLALNAKSSTQMLHPPLTSHDVGHPRSDVSKCTTVRTLHTPSEPTSTTHSQRTATVDTSGAA